MTPRQLLTTLAHSADSPPNAPIMKPAKVGPNRIFRMKPDAFKRRPLRISSASGEISGMSGVLSGIRAAMATLEVILAKTMTTISQSVVVR
ncbi:hypothetical protein B7760_03933 [Burkholderia glumae]|nr:hypothetical protein B7760_03933 [Burkholderia glumae]